jgi:GNAT superfamily N-acetyltransferase
MEKKMDDELIITTLNKSYDEEILEVLTQAFINNPNLQIICDKPEFTRDIIRNLMILYGGINNTIRHGILYNDKLVCASFSIDTRINPLILLICSFRLLFSFKKFKGIGLRCLKEFLITRLKMPRYQDRCRELLLFGTITSYQKMGFGEKLIKHLYKEAKDNSYKGMVGFTRPDKPAYMKLYKRHGWFIDKKFKIEDLNFAWIRIKI